MGGFGGEQSQVQPAQLPARGCPDRFDILMAIGLALFLLLLPFHLVVKRLIPGPVGTYWKESLLGVLLLLWASRCWRARRLLITDTPLDLAVLIYLAILVLRFVLDHSGWVGAWGLYVSILYLPLFWLVPTLLRRCPHWLVPLIAALVAVGTAAAMGGLLEFALNVSLWPSDEITQRQGFPGVFIYGTNIRRVYFTFDSPTTLANTLAMLLPLALTLFLTARNVWAKAGAALAAALLAACIVVTFSRGIWVATAVSLVSMALLGGLTRRPRRTLLVVAGVLTLTALFWLGILFALRPWQESTQPGVLELSQTSYHSLPVVSVHQDLPALVPVQGQVVTQTWTLPDPITGQGDPRTVLQQYPPKSPCDFDLNSSKDQILYALKAPETGALRIGIALSPDAWSPAQGDGVTFHIYVYQVEKPWEGRFIFQRYINPKHNPNDRRWRNYLVDLSPWAGQEIYLALITDSGPACDWSYDWAGWADAQIVSVEPDTFQTTQPGGAIVRHTRSVLDWTGDETNRDRLAAWSQSLTAWRGAPLWGRGLGTTGVAALRSQPWQAIITESQVLKALVELGPLGLLALAYLWFQIARVSGKAYRAAVDPKQQLLLLGVLTSLLIVFIEGLVYQNLEVKQVNAYFWSLVGALAFLAKNVAHKHG